jgi:hypothetical protein
MANKRPPLEIEEVTQSLKESKGQGAGVFFPPPPNNNAANNDVKPIKAPTVRRPTTEDDPQKTRNDVMTSLLQQQFPEHP